MYIDFGHDAYPCFLDWLSNKRMNKEEISRYQWVEFSDELAKKDIIEVFTDPQS